MKKSVTILDLFAGYGGAELSFKYAGIDVKKSYISEINPSALRVLEHHYPNAIFVGDIRNLNPMIFLSSVQDHLVKIYQFVVLKKV